VGGVFLSFQSRRKRDFYFSRLLPCAEKTKGHFEGVLNSHQNVSASFLDESVWKLAEENYHIIIRDPEHVIKNKLEKIKKWTQSNIQIKKHKHYMELAL